MTEPYELTQHDRGVLLTAVKNALHGNTALKPKRQAGFDLVFLRLPKSLQDDFLKALTYAHETGVLAVDFDNRMVSFTEVGVSYLPR